MWYISITLVFVCDSSVYAPANHTFAGWGCKFQGQSVFSLSLGETVNFKVTVFFSLSQAKAVNFKVTVFFSLSQPEAAKTFQGHRLVV